MSAAIEGDGRPYRLYLDDMRDIPMGMVGARSVEEFKSIILDRGVPAFISFDHDMADEHYSHHSHPLPYDSYVVPTGYHAAKWLVAHCRSVGSPIPEWRVHSLNPAGSDRIREVLLRGASTPDISPD